jgi:hypothetical protein
VPGVSDQSSKAGIQLIVDLNTAKITEALQGFDGAWWNFMQCLYQGIVAQMGIPAHFFWSAENWTTQVYFVHHVYPSEHPRGG